MERNHRLELVHSFMRKSHGRLAGLKSLHQQALASDPLFYAHLARWYQTHGTIRDHHEVFPAHLLRCDFPEFRDHGRVLLQYLRPYQVARVVRYSKEHLGGVSRALRQAVLFYLQRRESDSAWMDECLVRDRRSLKYLYGTLHLRPDQRTQKLLFEEVRLPDSRRTRLAELRQLADRPSEQAQFIRKHRIQFQSAIGAVRSFDNSMLDALMDVMTPQQVINHLRFFESKGAFGVPWLKQNLVSKIRGAVTESRVHDMKAVVALEQLQEAGSLREELYQMAQERLRARGSIERSTLLLVDKSGSMQECVEIGKQLATMISTVCRAQLWVECFDSEATTIVRPLQNSLEGWTKSFRYIRAGGATSIGVGLRKHISQRIEQIVVVTDGEDNANPLFIDAYRAYQDKHGFCPSLFVVRVQSNQNNSMETALRSANLDYTALPFQGDYYNLPNFVSLLCQGGQDLVEEVLHYPVYDLEDLNRLPASFDPVSCEIN